MTQTLHIQLLGEFYMQRRGEAISLSPLEQTLLAFLLLHRDVPQSRQQIAYLFWPDSSDAQARGQLRKLYYRMRRNLPEPDTYLEADTQTLQWRPDGPYTLDVAEFDRVLDEVDHVLNQAEHKTPARPRAQICRMLEEAAALYHGDLLPACYDDWIAPERLRLSQRYVRALEQLVALWEEERVYEQAIEAAERLLRYDPLHEPGYRTLMRLHALTGDRARAVRVYHTCATVLQRELDVEPESSTRQVYEWLLQAERPVQPVRTEPSPSGLAVITPLVGRHDEWDRLRALWGDASAGAPQAALIQGEAGIGKTRLAEELVQGVERQGGAAYTARCYAAEGALAYAPVVQWLRAGPLPPLEPVWQRELVRLLPELLTALDLEPPGPMSEPWQRQRFFEALARAFLSAPMPASKQRPLLLLLDDVQWCDQETLEWLHYLLHIDPRAPLLVLCTLRLEEMDDEHPLATWLRAMRRTDRLTELTLEPLNEGETHALAAQVAQEELDADLAACIYGESEGNPLFVVELARAGRLVAGREPGCPPQGLPPRIQSTIEGRLAQLSPAGRELAGLAATIGRGFSFAVLARACELDSNTLLRALDELWQRRVVREQSGDEYDFTHEKLRQVAYARLSAARQRVLHRRVAGALEAVYAADLDEVSGRVAVHYEQAGEGMRAVPYYLRAAQNAAKAYANRAAARNAEHVLALVPPTARGTEAEWRFRALSSLGQAYIRLGQPTRAEKRLTRAIALGRSLDCPREQVARLYYWLGRVQHRLGRHEDEVQAGQEGLAALGLTTKEAFETTGSQDPASLDAALLLSTVASGYDYTGDRLRARELWYGVADVVERLDYRPELAFIYSQVAIRFLRDKNLEGTERWLRLVEQKTASSHDERILTAIHQRRENISTRQGDLQSALARLHQALDHATRAGDLTQRCFYSWWIAFRCLSLGDLDQAEAWTRRALDLDKRINVTFQTTWLAWLSGLVSLCRGEQFEAAAALDQAVKLAAETGLPEVEVWCHQMLGRAHLDRGEREAAQRCYRRAVALCTPSMFANWRAREMLPYALFFASVLSGLEGAFADPAAFRAFCQDLPGREQLVDGALHSPDLAELALKQWYLEPATPAPADPGVGNLTEEAFHALDARTLADGWTWHDPFGDCRYTLREGVTLEAANGRDLWRLNQSAPRILVSLAALSSNRATGVAIETICTPAFADRPAMGGLLIWIDAQNYLRLDRGLSGPNEITLLGCLEDRDLLIGRGRLPPEPAGPGMPDRLGRAWLRFEWQSGVLRALCSADGESWYTAGQVELPFRSDAQYGIYACGNIDRTLYHGAYPEGAALRFESLRCWSA